MYYKNVIRLILIDMKRRNTIYLILFAILILPVSSYSAETEYKDYTDIGVIEDPVVPIEDIFQNRSNYHREIIVIEGK